MSENSSTRKTQLGCVKSSSMDKTVVVTVERKVKHKLYGKYIRRRVNYMAHDAANQCKIGDTVLIEECRPLSKNKRWLVRTIVQQAV
ncbi:MAG: SSU ribosomal protein S17P [Candidatus Electronema aureum]|jgi:small subunit ribosomal protein S17|uniref:Small ribosomal subunit protein uS17 n=1 Tax=Candidatus Electronema aureum TaxID=2005002 RepID=A0A521G4X0_9BACT|nr:30S ribosomal protein S17 [Desulfobulbus sp. F5]TAA76030.1 MAG: SSU ribosomal protein S17P [Candidatus Electronema aureum]